MREHLTKKFNKSILKHIVVIDLLPKSGLLRITKKTWD